MYTTNALFLAPKTFSLGYAR